MKSFVTKHALDEGHFNIFPERKSMWDTINLTTFTEICDKFSEKFQELDETYKKTQQQLHKQIACTNHLVPCLIRH